MAKPEQVLLIDPPNELVFRGPFTTPVSTLMKLSNPSDKEVCFRITTTAPKRYCVEPISGVIDPMSLQPSNFVLSETSGDKLVVQAMYAPDGEINQDTLWKETSPDKLMDSKLKCVFFMPDENNAGEGASYSDPSKKKFANPVQSGDAGYAIERDEQAWLTYMVTQFLEFTDRSKSKKFDILVNVASFKAKLQAIKKHLGCPVEVLFKPNDADLDRVSGYATIRIYTGVALGLSRLVLEDGTRRAELQSKLNNYLAMPIKERPNVEIKKCKNELMESTFLIIVTTGVTTTFLEVKSSETIGSVTQTLAAITKTPPRCETYLHLDSDDTKLEKNTKLSYYNICHGAKLMYGFHQA